MTSSAAFNQVGKRYACAVCGSEFIVTKTGSGQQAPQTCHDQPMAPK
jgi:hypothetical protein